MIRNRDASSDNTQPARLPASFVHYHLGFTTGIELLCDRPPRRRESSSCGRRSETALASGRETSWRQRAQRSKYVEYRLCAPQLAERRRRVKSPIYSV